MPKLLKDTQGYPNLYLNPKTGDYCVRKYVAGLGEKYASLRTKNRKEAIRRLTEFLTDWVGGKGPGGRIPFRTIALELLEIYSVKAEKTFLDYEGHLRLHLLPYFSKFYLDEVGKNWPLYKAHQRRVTPNRKLKHDRKHLISILNYAYAKELIHRIPELELDPQDRHVTKGRVFTVKEYWKLWGAANPKWRLIIEMAAVMGMRRKEIMHLAWVDIDLDRRMITLPSHKTKTRDGRIFPIEKAIFEILILRKTEINSVWVFPHREDATKPMDLSDRTWQRIQRRAGIRGRFHWLRHSNVTWALEAGHSKTLIGKARGMSPQVLERVYAHSRSDEVASMDRSVRAILRRRTRKNSELRQSSTEKRTVN